MEGPVVLDTSILIKWFRQGEVLAREALQLRDDYVEGRIAIALPSFVAYELANVLHYKADLSTEQVQAAVRSLFDMQMTWVPPSSATTERAVDLARAHETTVYDAVFAALAESIGATLITANARLAQRLAALPYVRHLGGPDVNAQTSGDQ
jgi:predicted nucleic acid-binding protein